MKKILTRAEAAREIERQTTDLNGNTMHCNAKWQKRWSPSSHFVLMRVPLSKVQQPKQPHSMHVVSKRLEKFNERPIFIDRNDATRTGWDSRKTHGRRLKTHVIDGKHRHMAATILGHKDILAYVGVQAIEHFIDEYSEGYNWIDYKPEMKKYIKKYRAEKKVQ